MHGSLFTNNYSAAMALPGATISISDSSVVGNSYSYSCGVLASTGDNRVMNNPSPGCSPNAVTTVQ